MQLPIELSHPCYHDEQAARVQLETIRWPNGPYCPICGSFDTVKPLGGKARSFHIANVTAQTVRPLIVTVTSRKSHFRTDESGIYWSVGEQFTTHRTVYHSADEYVGGDAYTNTVEGMFSLLKRGIYAIY